MPVGQPSSGFPKSEVLRSNQTFVFPSRGGAGQIPADERPAGNQAKQLQGKYKNNAAYLKLVIAAASNQRIEPEFLAAILTVENSGYSADVTRAWNPKAVSRAGARGIAQFMPGTWTQYGKGGDPFKPEDAIPAAARLLSALLKQHNGNRSEAAQSYNGGSYRGQETRQYAAAMEKAYQEYKKDKVLQGAVQGSLNIPNPLDALDPLKSLAEAGAELLQIFLSPKRWGELVAQVTAYAVKFLGKAIWDFVVAPVLHWHQRAAVYYFEKVMSGKSGSGFYYSIAGIVTVSFWATGYAILWAKVEDGASALAANPRDTALGKFVTGTRNANARRKLTPPGKVEEKTPTKPDPTKSATSLIRVNTLSVARGRPVRVTRGNPDADATPTSQQQQDADIA